MKKKGRKKMFVAFGVFIMLAGMVVVWFNAPYSPLKSDFNKDVAALKLESQTATEGEIFTRQDFAHLPTAIQKYVEGCGYLGTPKGV